jgi:putative amidoligase enzyme
MPPLFPPLRSAPDGAPRRVGVEIEFAGIGCAATAALLCRLYGGTVAELDAHRFAARGTRFGDFTVELDVSVAHPPRGGGDGVVGALMGNLRQAFGAAASLIMPCEVITPPLPIGRLADIDDLAEALRRAGARGTGCSPLYAFGLHLNPEAASFDADYIADHLKAFVLLAARLRAEIGVDLSRRLSPFIGRYPDAYARRVVDPLYRPALDRLIDDYVEANPTRNRELDLLPLFAHLDEARVRRRVSDPKIKPRPTFHYRLPNSRVDDADWGVVAEWNRWVAVERLAADRPRLDALGRDCGGAVARPADDWAERLKEWIA